MIGVTMLIFPVLSACKKIRNTNASAMPINRGTRYLIDSAGTSAKGRAKIINGRPIS